ncbi:MAG: hypothetical protein NUV55_03315 [Sulfuricaulis sp.]|uniref:hypothetical protein n=1 Tax=Sulfuricaulis sp. TaxID=2003553 RepID=UPI0025CF1AAB|nr:hypothetical protein [Sulfuricaulis sp.]MCR4346226.1 hypothetical protein [Sulfuricaulis sp.]
MKPFVVLLGLFAAFGSAGVMAESPKTLPMPPTFNIQIDADEALTKYPLGVITKVAAFAHHGQENRTVTLPNGYEGKVYQVGSGTGLRTYTLVFSDKGVVTDVLYNEQGRHNGLTALQLQAQAKRILGPDVEKQPYKKHAPDEFRLGK